MDCARFIWYKSRSFGHFWKKWKCDYQNLITKSSLNIIDWWKMVGETLLYTFTMSPALLKNCLFLHFLANWFSVTVFFMHLWMCLAISLQNSCWRTWVFETKPWIFVGLRFENFWSFRMVTCLFFVISTQICQKNNWNTVETRLKTLQSQLPE